ncbi:MAG: hypothetical protein JW726_10990 [Anaerolineales bacterium]|nr:hypothetical protein [Anaerolineales bacterium]
MTAIAGIVKSGKSELVKKMLEKMAHRGSAGRYIVDQANVTIGVTYPKSQVSTGKLLQEQKIAADDRGISPATQVKIYKGGIELKRDHMGIAPLYYGRTDNGILCFASEVKGLLVATSDINELLPGHLLREYQQEIYYKLKKQSPIDEPPEVVAGELHKKLEQAVASQTGDGEVAAWLSGGLDSSAIVALARPYAMQLHTFTAGLSKSPDLEYSRLVASKLQTNHHEVVATFEDLLTILPEVIYHLESFDALLVRSSMMNYMVAKKASDYAQIVLSGEGSDELFAGYSYLKSLNPDTLDDELVDITGRLHNTALQRVDRCATAHGTEARLGFLDPNVVAYALQIPIEYKLHKGIEKWVLRKALEGLLPDSIIYRPKAKFWEGAGVSDLIAIYADEHVSDRDFCNNRQLDNDWTLNSKEEMLYFQIFCEHFGVMEDLSWMGRTKGAPTDA